MRADVERTREPVVLVCSEPRCPAATDFYVGFERPANLIVVDAEAFAAAPLRPTRGCG